MRKIKQGERQKKNRKEKERKKYIYCGGMRVKRGKKELKKKKKKGWFIIVEFHKVQLLKICTLISSRIAEVY